MHYLTASEPEGHFDFITTVEKSLNLLGFHFEVVVANFGSHFDFAQCLSVVALFFLALIPLVAPFAVVHHFADRGIGVGGDFYKIELFGFGYLDRFSRMQVSQILAFVINDLDGTRSDSFVDPMFESWSFVVMSSSSSTDRWSPSFVDSIVVPLLLW